MQDEERLPDEAAPEVVETPVAGAVEDAEAETPEASEEIQAEAEKAGSPPASEEDTSETKTRRERRKAYVAELQQKSKDTQARLDRIKSAAEAGEAPNEEDFDDHTEYAAAKAVFMAAQHSAQREISAVIAERDELEKQRAREIDDGWNSARAEARTRLQNFDDVVNSLPAEYVSETMAGATKAADNGPDIAYHLGANPTEAARISSLPEVEQVFELGRLSASLKAPKPKVQSSAPPPLNPVSGRSNQTRDPSKMSTDEYREWRKQGGGS